MGNIYYLYNIKTKQLELQLQHCNSGHNQDARGGMVRDGGGVPSVSVRLLNHKKK